MDKKLNIIITAKDTATSVLKGIGVGLLGVGGAATAAFAGMGKLAAEAAPLEGIKAAFEGIAESSGQSANEMLAALERGSLGMVAQSDLMKTYNSAAQLVGTTFANQLPDAMQYLGKVSAATGEDMDYMLDSLVKGVGRLSPMILDNLGIQVALSEATERASAMFGVEADELDKAQTQAGMMAVVLEKLQENTAAMPDIAENASTKMAQMEAATKNLRQRIGLALIPVWSRLMGAFAVFAERYAPLVMTFFEDTLIPFLQNDLAPALEGLTSRLAELLPQAVEFLIGAAQDLMPILQEVAGWVMENVIPALADLWAWLMAALPEAIGVLSDVWTGILQPALATAFDIITNYIIPAFQTITGWFNNDLPAGVETAGGTLSGFVETATGTFNTLLSIVSPIFNEILAVITMIVGTIVSWVREHWWLIKEATSDTFNTIKTVIQGVLTVVGGIVYVALQAIKAFWEAHGQSILEWVRGVWQNIKGSIQLMLNIILGIIEVVLSIISGNWDNAWQAIKEVAANVWQLIKSEIQTTLNTIKSIVKLALDTLKSIFDIGWSVIQGVFKRAKDAVIGVVQGLVDKMKEVGKAIVDNLKAGIEGAWEGLKNWFSDKLTDLRNMLPFSEPKVGQRSPLFGLSESGKSIVTNLLSGLREAIPELEGALAGISVNIGDTRELALAGAARGGDVYINTLILPDVQDRQTLLEQLQGLSQS